MKCLLPCAKLYLNKFIFLDFGSAISSVLSHDSTNRVWQCLECGMTNKDKARVRRHAEVHFKDFVHSCSYCGVQKKSSEALRMHIHAYHKFAIHIVSTTWLQVTKLKMTRPSTASDRRHNTERRTDGRLPVGLQCCHALKRGHAWARARMHTPFQ